MGRASSARDILGSGLVIITDRFVFLHLPKTGGTFVNEAVLTAHGIDVVAARRWNSLYRWRARLTGSLIDSPDYGPLAHSGTKHDFRRDVPRKHRRKTVLATIRSPFDRMVSEYEFRWWTRTDAVAKLRAQIDLESEFPHFPDLDFSDYVRLHERRRGASTLGPATREAVSVFCEDPEPVLQSLDDPSGDVSALTSSLQGVRFLHTETLNADLYGFLREVGYREQDVEFLRTKDRVIPEGPGAARKSRDWRSYYTTELFDRVRRSERQLLKIFPEYEESL